MMTWHLRNHVTLMNCLLSMNDEEFLEVYDANSTRKSLITGFLYSHILYLFFIATYSRRDY
jgi:hypothetical protein